MSQENVEVVRRAIEAYSSHDLDAHLLLMDSEVEMTSRLIGLGTYLGHDGVREYWQDIFRTLPDLHVEIQELQDLGDLVLATLRLRGHGTDSAAPFDEVAWVTARVHNGKCVWWCAHSTKAEALEAVGLRE
jgi:ketosteroid isomerase-like protein